MTKQTKVYAAALAALSFLVFGNAELPDWMLDKIIPPAVAQTSCPNQTPGFTSGGTVFGRSKDQWNQYFAAKVDSVNGILCNPTVIGGSLTANVPAATVMANATAGTAPATPVTAQPNTLLIASDTIDFYKPPGVAGSYTNPTLTVDSYGRVTVIASGTGCSGTATGVFFANGGGTCATDTPNFVYSSTNGQLTIVNKQTTSMDPHAPAALILESPDVNIHGAIQVGQSNVSGSGGWGMWGYSDVGGYTYLNTGDASPIMLGSSLGATRTGINFTGCMVADIQCGHGDLQISGHRQNFESGSNYWALALGDGAALMGGFKLDTTGYPILQWGDSETSNFVPHIHIALNGNSYFNGIGGTNYVGFGTTSPGTQVDVNGFITTRSVLSCNTSTSALHTDNTGKIACGTITGTVPDGTNQYDFMYWDTGSGWTAAAPYYVIAFSSPQTTTYSASQVIGMHRFAAATTIPANFGSYLGLSTTGVGTATATGNTVFNVDKAASATPTTFSNVGTLTVGSGGAVISSMATSGGNPVSFASGDVVRLVAPASPDATFTGLSVTIALSRG